MKGPIAQHLSHNMKIIEFSRRLNEASFIKPNMNPNNQSHLINTRQCIKNQIDLIMQNSNNAIRPRIKCHTATSSPINAKDRKDFKVTIKERFDNILDNCFAASKKHDSHEEHKSILRNVNKSESHHVKETIKNMQAKVKFNNKVENREIPSKIENSILLQSHRITKTDHLIKEKSILKQNNENQEIKSHGLTREFSASSIRNPFYELHNNKDKLTISDIQKFKVKINDISAKDLCSFPIR